jgi:hypothetical protein
MKGGKNGKREKWKHGNMEGRKDEKREEWKEGKIEGGKHGKREDEKNEKMERWKIEEGSGPSQLRWVKLEMTDVRALPCVGYMHNAIRSLNHRRI